MCLPVIDISDIICDNCEAWQQRAEIAEHNFRQACRDVDGLLFENDRLRAKVSELETRVNNTVSAVTAQKSNSTWWRDAHKKYAGEFHLVEYQQGCIDACEFVLKKLN